MRLTVQPANEPATVAGTRIAVSSERVNRIGPGLKRQQVPPAATTGQSGEFVASAADGQLAQLLVLLSCPASQ
jgi:hypothetical protein